MFRDFENLVICGLVLAFAAVLIFAARETDRYDSRPCLRWGEPYQTLDCVKSYSRYCDSYRWVRHKDCVEWGPAK